MASANLNLMRSMMYGAWEHGNFNSVEWAHPEIDYVFADGPDSGSKAGLPGMAESWHGWASAWEEFRVEADEYRELDDERVLVLVHYGGRGKTSGVDLGEMKAKAANLFHVRGGKVIRYVVWFDRERASRLGRCR